MALDEGLEPAKNMFVNGVSHWGSYIKWLIPLVIVIFVVMGIWFFKKIRSKKTQWTHKLRVRRVLDDGRLSKEVIHNMRRFPLIKNAEVFELEKPLLGIYLMPEIEEYSDTNEYSIILDKNNRIYINKGDFFNPDKSAVYVSAKHAEIDIGRSNLRSRYQDINKISKRVEWSAIAKYAFLIIAIISLTIVGIVGLQKWADSQQYRAEKASSEAEAWRTMEDVMTTMEAVVNTQQLELKKMLEELYGTKNIRQEIGT